MADWVEQMGQDEEKKMEDRQQELLEAELQLFHGEMGISMDVLAMGGSIEQALKAAQLSSEWDEF